MTLLHTLRNTPRLALGVLLWFVVSLAAAVASPLVQPHNEVMVCSTAGMVKVVVDQDGTLSANSTVLQCPLCTLSCAPPATLHARLPSLQMPDRVQPCPTPPGISRPAATPPPSRGPPTLA